MKSFVFLSVAFASVIASGSTPWFDEPEKSPPCSSSPRQCGRFFIQVERGDKADPAASSGMASAPLAMQIPKDIPLVRSSIKSIFSPPARPQTPFEPSPPRLPPEAIELHSETQAARFQSPTCDMTSFDFSANDAPQELTARNLPAKNRQPEILHSKDLQLECFNPGNLPSRICVQAPLQLTPVVSNPSSALLDGAEAPFCSQQKDNDDALLCFDLNDYSSMATSPSIQQATVPIASDPLPSNTLPPSSTHNSPQPHTEDWQDELIQVIRRRPLKFHSFSLTNIP